MSRPYHIPQSEFGPLPSVKPVRSTDPVDPVKPPPATTSVEKQQFLFKDDEAPTPEQVQHNDDFLTEADKLKDLHILMRANLGKIAEAAEEIAKWTKVKETSENELASQKSEYKSLALEISQRK